MPKKDGTDYIISETGNWNVADDYSKKKIMRPLFTCDYYEDVANFGYESLGEELLSYNLPPNEVVKIKALKRLIKELIKIINNAKFALKKPGTRDIALKYKEQLKKIQDKVVPNLIKVTHNQIKNTKTIKITNLQLFEDVLEKVSEIKSKINEPLNKNHLIFTDKEEFDPKKFKQNLKDRMVEQG